MPKVAEEQANDMMLMMEQLAGDIRELTYAIRENTEVIERANDPAGIGEIRERVMNELKGTLHW